MHISSVKAEVFLENLLITFLHKSLYLSRKIFANDLFKSFAPTFLLNYIQFLISATGQTIIGPTAKTAFHHCTFQFIIPHFVHHCTVKLALHWTNLTSVPNYLTIQNTVILSSSRLYLSISIALLTA